VFKWIKTIIPRKRECGRVPQPIIVGNPLKPPHILNHLQQKDIIGVVIAITL